jgi:hypothetical protein
MDFTIDTNGISLTITSPFELDLTYVQDFLDSLLNVFEIEFDDAEDDGVEFDDEGAAWWFDEEAEEWYYFDEETEEWELYEGEENEE